jgi:hypothetical protein
MALRRALRLLIAVVLMAAWQTALRHPLAHVDAHGAFVHVGGGHLPPLPGDRKAPNPLCDALAAVAACVAGTGTALAVAPQASHRHISPPIASTRSASALAYRSQAPPVVL